jgi:hypothetical protein
MSSMQNGQYRTNIHVGDKSNPPDKNVLWLPINLLIFIIMLVNLDTIISKMRPNFHLQRIQQIKLLKQVILFNVRIMVSINLPETTSSDYYKI